MRNIVVLWMTVVCVLVMAAKAGAQAADSSQSASVPRLISVNGVFQPANGQPPSAGTVVTLSLYADQTGGALLWQEIQTVTTDSGGRFTLLLGATQPDGVPLDIFASGEARWLGMQFAGAGEVERPRIQILSVPYALRAADAATLGGHPASAYMLAPTSPGASSTEHAASASAAGSSHTSSASTSSDVGIAGTGMANSLAKFVDSTDVTASAVYESAGAVGINTTSPADFLHIKFSNTNGTATGLAVQNTGTSGAPYSGMLFYDQNGAVAQFQGFNNLTHEYRINNVASSASINFMTASTSRFLVAPNGNIGIGTLNPSALLEVSNAVNGATSNVWTTSFTNAIGPYYLARRSRGTAAAPAAVQAGDGLSGLYGMGYDGAQFGPAFTGGITVQAAQNFANGQQGTALTFSTTSINSTTPATRMILDPAGNLGIGTPAPATNLEVSNATNGSPFGGILGSSFTGSNPAGTLFVGRKARGTVLAPTAVQSGDSLAGFFGWGYGATSFAGFNGGMVIRAAENFTDSAQGTNIQFSTAAAGTTAQQTRVTIDQSGNVGIGTTSPGALLEVSQTGSVAAVVATAYANAISTAIPFMATRFANGTAAAPSAVQSGNAIGVWSGAGYGTTKFGDVTGGMTVLAQENWTDAAQGTATGLFATAIGSLSPQLHMAVLPSGNVGIGDWAITGGTPAAADRLQVFGDIRVGVAGTDGCVKNFAGTGIIGTCSSDRRLKKNITPFGPVLDKLTALQPVHYYWRTAEFPDRHFGDSQAYGLIAQDVEEVMPELVVTGEDGYKAVDYTKLPLLTIQAVRELKQRVAELERLIEEMRATLPKR
jgi:hypothetical protein